jgi:endonuclease/exonuclease/phosphatase family metal-dependent hydrolase
VIASASVRLLAVVAFVACAAVARAQGFDVATWNLTWLMDAPAHARWAAACAAHGWRTDLDALAPAERAALAGLPFCNVHNGMAFPPDACASTRDGWPLAARYPDDHPCRDTADLATGPRYAQKLSMLREMFARLDAMGVRLLAVQEVLDAHAVRAILPPHWHVVTTRELPGTPVIAQHVGVAWRQGLRVRDFEAINTLADSGVANRPLRPGLAFTVDVGGKPVRVLVVHLKAGCRSRDLDAPLARRDATLPPERQDAIASDCALLRYQLPALEAWVDANASRDFALMGDFNRTLLREPVADSDTYRTRLDGTSAGDPLGTCTMSRDGNRLLAQCTTRTRAIFPELNDGQPRGAVLWRARFADLARGGIIPPRSSGDCTIPGSRGDLTHDGVDHIVISASLKERLARSALTMRVVNYLDEQGRPLSARADRALPSDHCPHVVTWTPR